MTQHELDTRYKEILYNTEVLVQDERDCIPITSTDSSWYWVRKEFQTRLEYFLRGITLPVPELAVRCIPPAPAKGDAPNVGDVLFRYGEKKYLPAMLIEGTVRLRSAWEYGQIENDAARKDEETVKRSYLPGDYVRMTKMDGRKISVVGDVAREFSTSNYYLLCLSSAWDERLFAAFNGTDSCLVIWEGDQLGRRLSAASQSKYPGCISALVPVHYFDPYDMGPRAPRDPVLMKDFRFAYQQEWRFLCMMVGKPSTEPAIFLNVGPLADAATLFDRTGRPL